MRTGSPTRHARWTPWLASVLFGVAMLGTHWVAGSKGGRPASDSATDRGATGTSTRAESRSRGRGVIVVEVTSVDGKTPTRLQVGDRILTANDVDVLSPTSLQSVFENALGAHEITLRIERQGVSLTVVMPIKESSFSTRPDLRSAVLRLYEEADRIRRGDPGAATDLPLAKAWTIAAAEAERSGDAIGAAWLHSLAAQALEAEQRWSEALESYRESLDQCASETDDAFRSRLFLAQARCNQQLRDVEASMRSLEEARRLDAAAGRHSWEGGDLHTLGVVAWQLGDFDGARGYFTDAVSVRERWLPNTVQLSDSLNGLGAVAHQQGDLDRAEMYYSRALELSERVRPDSLAVADAMNNLSILATLRGNLDTALELNMRSLAIREKLAPDSEAVSAALTNLGILEYRRGRLQAALDHYTRSLAIHERQGKDSLECARDFINMGAIAYERGDLDGAQDYYSRSLSILERLVPDSSDCIACVYNLGMVAADRGDWDLAQQNLERALTYRERTAPDSLLVAETCDALGNLAFSRLDFATAEKYYLRALAIEERIAPGSLLMATSLHNLGGVAVQRGRFDEATQYYKRSLAIRERLAPGCLDLASCLHGIGDVALRQGKPEEALPRLQQAIDTIEAQRDHILGIQSRAFLLARFSEPYITLQRAYIAIGNLAAAFQAHEKARARSLLDGLSEARADIREGVDPTLLAREHAIQEKIAATDQERQTLRSSGAPDAEIAANEKLINTLLIEYEDIQGKIRRASPRYAALTQPQPSSLEEIQRDLLDDDTVLLEYALGLEAGILWWVTKSEIRAFDMPPRDEVDRAARRVHELVTARNLNIQGETAERAKQRIEQADQDLPVACAALSAMVLGPVADRLESKRLLIVADGALQYVPFGALPEPTRASPGSLDESGSSKTAVASPLIAAHEIVCLPSASVLAVLRREIAGREPAPKSVAVLADPVLVPEDTRVKRSNGVDGKTRSTSTPDSATPKDGSRGVARLEATTQRLRFTRLEAESILALAPDNGFPALDFAANKSTAMSPDLGQYRILHLATHGLFDSQFPELSGIVLSRVDEHGNPRDGFLRLHEIYNLRLNADLVVLSACQTALGREIRGEGLIGLTRGFMYAGAARVVASLWNVQDKATAELMTSFYEAMFKDHQSPAAALRSAQVKMWKAGRPPYYWAAFLLQGEYR